MLIVYLLNCNNMKIKALLPKIFGIYTTEHNKTIVGYKTKNGKLTTTEIKTKKFVKKLHKIGKTLENCVSVKLTGDEHIFKPGYL